MQITLLSGQPDIMSLNETAMNEIKRLIVVDKQPVR